MRQIVDELGPDLLEPRSHRLDIDVRLEPPIRRNRAAQIPVRDKIERRYANALGQADLLRRSQPGCGADKIIIKTFRTNADALLQVRTGRAVARDDSGSPFRNVPFMVPISSACTLNEYNDPWDVMGAHGSRHSHGWHLQRLGVRQDGFRRLLPLYPHAVGRLQRGEDRRAAAEARAGVIPPWDPSWAPRLFG